MDAQLKPQLLRTWPVFFAGHGSLTEVQRRAMPVVLAGRDTLLVAATASGKTEAALVPLLERHVLGHEGSGLRLLYLCPTRALVRDLFGRLTPALRSLGVAAAMKSGDTGPLAARRPPTVLFTTPESTDSLLTRFPRLFKTLEALVLDEIHLLDESPRGDQVRCLLKRIETIRHFSQPERSQLERAQPGRLPVQRVALSATVDVPEGVAARYLRDAVIVQIAGHRAMSAEIVPTHGLGDLTAALSARAAKKTLVFCNTRHEVEQVATFLRKTLPFEATVLVHYANLDSAMRREVETRFTEASVAVCVSTSTLELGVDIGSVDEVALLGPPPSLSAFLQRVGRGGRRRQGSRVLCLARSVLEIRHFDALLSMAHGFMPELPARRYHFRPSVVVQQTFSLLKQSPTGGLRLADLRASLPETLTDEILTDEILVDETLRGVLDHLVSEGYLTRGRPGEWRVGPGLNELADQHELYSNIGGDVLTTTVVDAYSGRPLARTHRSYPVGATLLLAGRPVEVAWRNRHTFAVKEGKRSAAIGAIRPVSSRQAVPLELAQGVALTLGFGAGEMPLLNDPHGLRLFHFWGDVYGAWLAAILQEYCMQNPTREDEPFAFSYDAYTLRLPFPLQALPPWDGSLALDVLKTLVAELEPYLELGRFQTLLPPEVAPTGMIGVCDVVRFEALYRAAALVNPVSSELCEALRELY